MAFRDHFENAPLLLRTIRGTFDVTGRARRTELGWWYLASLVVSGLIDAVAGRLLSPWARSWSGRW